MAGVSLHAPLHHVVGSAAKAFEAELGLRTVGDLLRHYPRRYQERGRLMPFAELVVGEHATVLAEVVSASGRDIRPKLHKLDVVLRDDTGARLTLALFNRRFLLRQLTPGRRALFAGEVTTFNGRVQVSNPEVVLLEDDDGAPVPELAGTLLPLYPATKALNTVRVARGVRAALEVADLDTEVLPPALRASRGLLPLRTATELIHRPASWADVQRARDRLVWDEALVLQVLLAQRRLATEAQPATARPGRRDGLLDRFLASLPFTLTAGQREVVEVLATELAGSRPLHRLLQGEVGAGKTLVALLAMLQVVDSGGQAALLAPTEVLAQQHARSLRTLLGPLASAGELGADEDATRVALLTGSLGAAARRTARAEVASGAAGLVVGTHALLSGDVAFADLGLVVVDEQHRFGVEQRDALRAKGEQPHVLVMTATPIPRTVAMTVYGDLEVSSLSELPAGRAEIRSAVVPAAERPAWLDTAWVRVREAVEQGRQAFVVCARIGEDGPGAERDGDAPDGSDGSEASDGTARQAAAVVDVVAGLRDGALRGLRLEALHGRMTTEAKDDVMARFVRGEVDVLVATTVIEVGVDVPNATVMVVLDADRFGVSQLHQLRGRVGRGAHGGLCLLVTWSPEGTPARERLDAVAATTDGFALAQVDLEQRREGDVLGARQSGTRSSLRLLRLADHEEVIVAARTEATALVAADPELASHPALRDAVRAWVDAQRADYLDKG